MVYWTHGEKMDHYEGGMNMSLTVGIILGVVEALILLLMVRLWLPEVSMQLSLLLLHSLRLRSSSPIRSICFSLLQELVSRLLKILLMTAEITIPKLPELYRFRL